MLNTPTYSLPKLTSKPVRRRTLISLTPLIDVVFILLVFFMLASSFLDWQAIPLQVGDSDNATAATEPRTLMLSLDQGQMKIDGQPVSLPHALNRARDFLAADPQHSLLIRPLGDTSLQVVVKLLDRLQAERLNRLTLVRDRQWRSSDVAE